MIQLTSTFVSRSLVPTISPRLRLRPRSVVPMTICMNQSRMEKVVVIMGATGTGKSRLSVDLATRFSGEIINSDKMQFYDGLEITTNQISISERCGVPHHLLGELPHDDDELTASKFKSLASQDISEIVSRGKLPIIAGGSNTFIHALLVDRFEPETHPFSDKGSISSDLRYDCCFLWVDVSVPVLFHHLSKRVDQMMESGMLEELAGFYNPRNSGSKTKTGIHKAIGVPEFDRYFEVYPPGKNEKMSEWDPVRKAAYEEAVKEIKENTWLLAKKQIDRIIKLRSSGWEIHRLDATASFGKSSREVWDKTVLDESIKIVKRFLLTD
ncbi:Adenylate isopentenyltransferase 8 [Cardamine amara subsp. amara]|uniref:adenylate dimethylallyltransferase (ADP/ATP-dependent) n=1 Tax=Cardamine amara subsp. amara TaxID=228776 RepID=A0ABD1A9R7_CARAN